MNTQIISISPAKAKWLLAVSNTKNVRKVNYKQVMRYAADMRIGRWETTHQGLAFTGPSIEDPGVLVDGQHRLTAIAGLDHPITLSVTFGAPDNPKIDYGMRRTLATVTGLDKRDLAACAVIIAAIKNTSATPAQMEALNEEFPSLGAFRGRARYNPFISRAPVYAAFGVVRASGYPEVEGWYDQIINNSVEMPQPLRVLRSKLETEHQKMFSGVSKRIPAYAITLKALHASLHGIEISKFYPDSIFANLEAYDGKPGEFVRNYLK